MAKELPEKGERAGPSKARRKPLTIDLPAEEVSRRESAADATTSYPTTDPAAGTTASAVPSSQSSSATPAPDSMVAGNEAGSAMAPQELPSAATRLEPPPRPVPPEPPKPPRREPLQDASPPKTEKPAGLPPLEQPAGRSWGPLLVGACIGGVAVAALFVILVTTGIVAPFGSQKTLDEVAALRSEIAALKDAASVDRVTPVENDVAAIKKSLADLSAGEGAPPPDMSGIESRLSALSDDVTALKNAGPADTAPLASAVAELQQKVDALASEVAGSSNDDRLAAVETKLDNALRATEDDAALGRAVAADALAAALESGRLFSAELAALKTLGAKEDAVTALEPYAGAGLPTRAKLRADFETAIAGADLSVPIPEAAGALDRLVEGARSLVSVRPAHPTAGSDPTAIVTRIRGALAVGDIKAALAEWSVLPDTMKSATKAWADSAHAWQTADDLVASLRADALARIEGR